jgi:threonine/homoserine/homoserine lactone efflux protein
MPVLPFVAVAVVVLITSGMDMALVTKNGLLHRRRSAVLTALGVNPGVAVWVRAPALGLAAVIAASATAFALVKLAGAAYLTYLGRQALRASCFSKKAIAHGSDGAPLRDGVAFRQDVVNARGAFNAMGIAWLVSYAAGAAGGQLVLSRPAVERTVDRISAVVLIGLGVRLALEQRR